MLNAKSLGVEKQIVETRDDQFIKPSFDITQTKIQELSDSFCTYNKNVCVFDGYMRMKPSSSLKAMESVLNLPVLPVFDNPYILGFTGNKVMTFIVNSSGKLIRIAETDFTSSGDYVYMMGTFPIKVGGGGS